MYKYLFVFGSKMQLYPLLNFLSFFPVLIFNLCRYRQKEKNLSALSLQLQASCQKNVRLCSPLRFLKRTRFYTITEIILLSCLQFFPVMFLNPLFSSLFNTGANYFGSLFLLQPILFSVYWLIGLEPLRQTDLTTPAFPLSLVVVKLACFCEGCCRGIESTQFGMYNRATYRMEIPVQLIEAGCALLLFAVLMLLRKKAKPGTLFPLYTLLYSATRFCSEFLRCEENILGPLKKYHIFCLVGIAVGILEYIIAYKFGDRIDVFIANGLPTLLKKHKNGGKKHKKGKKKKKH